MNKSLSCHEYQKVVSSMLMVAGPLRISTSYIGIRRIPSVSSGPHFAHILKSQIQSPAFNGTNDNYSPRHHSTLKDNPLAIRSRSRFSRSLERWIVSKPVNLLLFLN